MSWPRSGRTASKIAVLDVIEPEVRLDGIVLGASDPKDVLRVSEAKGVALSWRVLARGRRLGVGVGRDANVHGRGGGTGGR